MMSYEVSEAKKALSESGYNCNDVEVLELDIVRARADIGKANLDPRDGGSQPETGIKPESRQERAEVTHLVYCWYPLGHNVSE